ncbi:MAG TPA: EAL domain-containing protein [Gammaproteobacteria bacterium]|nr:EAL domain-containing protein [Gammaproteobacteria bacterium]
MSERGFLPVLVLAQTQNHAEKLNGMLRAAGHAVRSAWAGNVEDAEKALKERRPDVIFYFLQTPGISLEDVVALPARLKLDCPVLAVTKQADEASIAATIRKGARDLVSIDNAERLEAVLVRELEVMRQSRALRKAEDTLRGYQERFQSFLQESGDAIAYVQDGIHVNANPAYLELFGHKLSAELEGLPVMDLFVGADQTRLKDALRDVAKGKSLEPLKLKAATAKGEREIEIALRQVEIDGEPCVELAIRSEADTTALEAQMAELGKRDPVTGLYHRHYFAELLTQELATSKAGVVRALVLVKPDKFSAIEERIGPLATDEVLKQLAEIVTSLVEQNDVAARFGGNIFTVLMQRPSLKQIELWADKLRTTVAGKIFEAGGQSTSMTVSIGIADFADEAPTPGAIIGHAQQAGHEARAAGGNRIKVYTPPVRDKEGKISDVGWVKKITTALKQNNFQLVYQPIASLQGDVSEFFDVLVRMIDEDGKEIMPGEFIPAAIRNGLMVGIDRWIMDKAFKVLAERARENRKTRFFIRLSDQSLVDATLPAWVEKQLAACGVPTGSVVFQIAEQAVEKHLKEAKEFTTAIKRLNCGIAIEHFGIGHNPLQIFEHLRMDFVKIDGSLMPYLQTENPKRALVQQIIEKTQELGIDTVAERVENANTMAVLWQLGVNYIQGNYVQEPEVIMADNARLPSEV